MSLWGEARFEWPIAGAKYGVSNVLVPVDIPTRIEQRRFVNAGHGSETSDDASLVEAARDGSRAAFEGLYNRYARLVHGILLSRIPPPEVEDLVQDVFLLALRKLHTLRDCGAFGGWLAMIARNRAADYHRRSPETAELPEALAANSAEHSEASAVLAVIRSLPEAYRETLILRLVEGMTGPEIAARTGLTPGSVRVNLHRGMQLLRTKLGTRNNP